MSYNGWYIIKPNHIYIYIYIYKYLYKEDIALDVLHWLVYIKPNQAKVDMPLNNQA